VTEEKGPCPHCGRREWRMVFEARVADYPDMRMEKRCDYCAPLRMQAYYYGFARTGNELVDRILSAVAQAGKGYHHTEGWNEPIEDWGPFRGGDYVEWIQNAANDAAAAFKALESAQALR
jgi:hypothetical protein